MKSALRRVGRWLGTLYLVYLALCLLVVFPLLNIMAPGLIKDALNRELQSEIILFNPFTLTLEVRRAALLEDDGHTPISFRQLAVNLSLSSIWEPGIVLDGFTLRELAISVLRYDDGEFHFADLIEGSDDNTEPGSPPPAITIRDLLLDARSIRYTDRTRPGPYVAELRDLSLRKQNLTTVPDRSGDGTLVLSDSAGGTLRWKGDTQLAAGRSQGELTLRDLDLTPAWRYEAEALGFVTRSARLDAAFNYTASWLDGTAFTLRDSEVRLHAVDLQPAESLQLEHTSLLLDELRFSGIEFDLTSQRVAMQQLSVGGLDVQGFDRDGTVSLQTMFAMPDSGATVDGDDPETKPSKDEESAVQDSAGATENSEWTLAVTEVLLDQSRVRWRTPSLSPEVMDVSPLRFQAGDIRWPAEAAAPFSLELAVNESARSSNNGSLHFGNGQGELRFSLQQLPLSWINPLVNETTRTDIARGLLSVQGGLTLDDFTPQSLTTGLQIDDFATVLHETQQEAFTLEQLAVSDAEINLSGQSARIGEIALQRPTGSLHVLEDGRMNINGVVRGDPATEAAEDESNEEASTAENTADESTASEAAWDFALDKFTLRNGRLDFADDSLPLKFKTVVDAIEADATDIATGGADPLQLVFTGSVDGYAPVRIEGNGRPLADSRDGVLQLDFNGMDIATMSPYSGTYAGYAIDSGTLSLNLRYALAGQQLEGDNRIVISQMALGEPIDSDLAIDIPLKLGLALLTDRQGVIDLRVPVSGNVDDPSFSLGPIIGMAIKNIIVKAVTAPFSLLAGLVGSEEDLERVAFAAGEDSLDATARGTLATLADALTQRPQLQLRILGGADPEVDANALREQSLRESLIADGLAEASIDLRDEAFLAAVENRYQELGVSASDDSGEPVDPDTQWRSLIDATSLAPTALQSLATARAAAAKRELVTVDGIDAARIAISYDASVASSAVKMAVDS